VPKQPSPRDGATQGLVIEQAKPHSVGVSPSDASKKKAETILVGCVSGCLISFLVLFIVGLIISTNSSPSNPSGSGPNPWAHHTDAQIEQYARERGWDGAKLLRDLHEVARDPDMKKTFFIPADGSQPIVTPNPYEPQP
jgi:hypothetical protein